MADGPKVVSLPERNEGNGARELLIEYFDGEHYLRHALLDGPGPNLGRTDHLLGWLWERGFKVVPIEGIEATPKMIEAGFAALRASCLTDDLLEADRLTVAEIYRAMVLAQSKETP